MMAESALVGRSRLPYHADNEHIGRLGRGQFFVGGGQKDADAGQDGTAGS
jgi:hypothetical protein